MSRVVKLLSELIAFPSVSHTSNQAITEWVAVHLKTLGFDCEQTRYQDSAGVWKFNLVAKRMPSPSADAALIGGLAYFCHTDVVPADRWSGPGGNPFNAVLQDDRLYGRGACDMKGSLAAMLVAIESVDHASQRAPLWFVCTADEEVGLTGAKQLVQNSACYRELVTHDPVALIGEPTELKVVYAHKGMGGFRVVSRGRAAHSSTEKGVNANVAMIPILQTILELHERSQADPTLRDDRFDPPTLTFNFGISDHAQATNVVPDRCVLWANWRTMPNIDGGCLMDDARASAEQLGLTFQSFDTMSPMQTPLDDPAVQTFCELAKAYAGTDTAHTVCYGTDGAVLTELNHRIVCGPGSIEQAHTVDEYIELESLDRGVALFVDAIKRLV